MLRLRLIGGGLAVAACLAVLAGCGGSATPQLIGAYPRQVIATYVPPPPNTLVVYNADLELSSANVESAARQAASLAYSYGGYLAGSQTWYSGADLNISLSLAVPVANYAGLHDALLGLGRLENERVTGDLVRTGYDQAQWTTYSNLMVHFRPAASMLRLPELPSFGWSPAGTFRSAFGVFAALFTFVVDIVIWVMVVIGPFVLMGFGLRALVRRLRSRA